MLNLPDLEDKMKLKLIQNMNQGQCSIVLTLNHPKEYNKKDKGTTKSFQVFHICRAKSFLSKLSAKWNKKKSFSSQQKSYFESRENSGNLHFFLMSLVSETSELSNNLNF